MVTSSPKDPALLPYWQRANHLSVYWEIHARKMYVSAHVLWLSHSKDGVEELLGYGPDSALALHTKFSFGMLAGLALELLLKACVVATTGSPPNYTHDLLWLASQTQFKPSGVQRDTLAILREYIESYGKYPTLSDETKYIRAQAVLEKQRKYIRKPFGNSHLRISVIDKRRTPSWPNFEALWDSVDSHYSAICELARSSGRRTVD